MVSIRRIGSGGVALGLALGDTAASAASSFIVGVAAAILLSPEWLGAYQILYVAGLSLSVSQSQRRGAPLVRERATGVVSSRQLRSTVSGMFRGGLLTAALTIVPLAYLALQTELEAGGLAFLGAGACALVVFVPIRDALRSFGHVSNRRLVSFVSSLVQLSVVGLFVALIWLNGLAGYFLLAVLSLGAASASLFSYCVLHRELPPLGESVVGVAPFAFAWSSALPQIVALWSNAIVGIIGGLAMVGSIAAAGQLAQALFFLLNALNMTLMGTSTRAGATGNLALAKRGRLMYVVGATLAGSLVAVFLVAPMAVSALTALVPNAFTVPGLALLYLVGIYVDRLGAAESNELVGAGHYKAIGNVQRAGAVVGFVVPLSAIWLGEFSIPVSLLVAGSVRYCLFRRASARLYVSD